MPERPTHEGGERLKLWELRERASKEPLDVDISNYGDEWCAGFLAGQANALDAALMATATEAGRG